MFIPHSRGGGKVGFEFDICFDPEGANGHRQGFIGPHGEDEVHELAFVEMLRQVCPGSPADVCAVNEFIDGAEQGAIHHVPFWTRWTFGDPTNLLSRQPGGLPETHVLRPLVVAPPAGCEPEDQDLPLPGGKARGEEDVPVEGEVGLGQLRMAGKGVQEIPPVPKPLP